MNGGARAVQTATNDNNRVTWRINFMTIGRITVSLPLGSLLVCFISAIIFQFDEVNQTVCEVGGKLLSKFHESLWLIRLTTGGTVETCNDSAALNFGIGIKSY